MRSKESLRSLFRDQAFADLFCCGTRAPPYAAVYCLAMRMKLFLLPVVSSAILALASCSPTTYGPIDDKAHDATYEPGVPGGTVVETYDLTATVTEVDASTRKVTLVAKNGKKATVKCGPEVINFDQIRVGDVV